MQKTGGAVRLCKSVLWMPIVALATLTGAVGSALVAREFAAIRALVRVAKIAVNN